MKWGLEPFILDYITDIYFSQLKSWKLQKKEASGTQCKEGHYVPCVARDTNSSGARSILQKFPDVRSAAIFGSRAKGNYKNSSDIDVAIHAPDMSSRDFARLCFEIEATPIIFKMDIVHFDTLDNPTFAAKILSEEQAFYVPKNAAPGQ